MADSFDYDDFIRRTMASLDDLYREVAFGKHTSLKGQAKMAPSRSKKKRSKLQDLTTDELRTKIELLYQALTPEELMEMGYLSWKQIVTNYLLYGPLHSVSHGVLEPLKDDKRFYNFIDSIEDQADSLVETKQNELLKKYVSPDSLERVP